MRSRQARRRAEQIYTERAKANFPPVSSVILHRDGSVEERPPPRHRVVVIQREDLCGTYLVTKDGFYGGLDFGKKQDETDQIGSHQNQASIPERISAWLRQTLSKLSS